MSAKELKERDLSFLNFLLFQALGALFKSFIYCLQSQSRTLFGKLQAFSSQDIIMQQSSNSLGELCLDMKSNYLKEFLC